MNEVDETASVSMDPPPKKMTPKKKQLATKVRKSPANKKKKIRAPSRTNSFWL